MSRAEICTALLALAFVGLLAFLLVDCSAGQTRHYECVVTRHKFVDAWTEVLTETDGEGNSQVRYIEHDEEWHLICAEQQGSEKSFDCQVHRNVYETITNGQSVTVGTRVGRWSGADYLPRIEF